MPSPIHVMTGRIQLEECGILQIFGMSDHDAVNAHEIKFRISFYEKNSRMHVDRLQNKCTNYKGVKNNTKFGQITGIQEKLDITCK